MTVSEMMSDALKYDELLLAYSIFWGIQKKIFNGNDNANDIHFESINMQEVSELMEQNLLGIDVIHLYSIKTPSGNFYIILAENEQDASEEYFRKAGMRPEKVIDITIKMDTEIYSDKPDFRTIRDVKDSGVELPHLVMIFEK